MEIQLQLQLLLLLTNVLLKFTIHTDEANMQKNK